MISYAVSCNFKFKQVVTVVSYESSNNLSEMIGEYV